jgi:hypothetical protein
MAEIHAAMNNTKWDELRLAMYGMKLAPRYRTMSTNGYYSRLDFGWYYHFRNGGYDDIRYVDIFAESDAQRDEIRSALKTIHVPGEETVDGFRVYGYALPGQALDYL